MEKSKVVMWSIVLTTMAILGVVVAKQFGVRAESNTSHQVLFISDIAMEDSQFLQDRLSLDPSFLVNPITSSQFDNGDLSEVDIVIINDVVLSTSAISDMNTYIQAGGNVIFLMGPETTQNVSSLETWGVLLNADPAVNIEKKLVSDEDANFTLHSSIDWASSPEVLNYTILDIVNGGLADSNYEVGVIINSEIILEESHRLQQDPFMLKYTINTGALHLCTVWLGSEAINDNFQLWPFYNYVWFTIMADLVNESIPKYGDWKYSPVPHTLEQISLGVFVLLSTVIMFGLYARMRKQSKQKISTTELQQIAIEEKKTIDLKNPWEQIGPHRQISGFLFSLFASLLIVLPQLAVTSIIMPQFIQPYPQVSGWYSWTKNFFQAIWILFDVGTSLAMIKYFAQYRVKQPEKAIHYIQIFVWWQMFSGSVQIAMFAFAGSLIFPALGVAHMSWIFIIHSMIQYPGWFLVFMYVFSSMQRTDKFAINRIFNYIVFPIIGQIIFILIFRAWGRANPMYGEAFGAGIGYGLGSYLGEWLTFGFGMMQFKRMGFHVQTIFRVDFTKQELKESLTYGFRLTLGAIMPPLIWLLQMYLVSIWILNWSAEQGYFDLIASFMILVNVVSIYYDSSIGAISEAKEHGKHKLTSLYISEGFKWGFYFLFFLVAFLAAVGDKIIIGASGPNWTRAVIFIPLYLVFQIFGPISWLGDGIFEGTGRTDLAAYAWVLEQVLRAAGLILFLHPDGPFHLGMIGVLWAYIPSLIIKDIFVMTVIYWKISKYRFYLYLTVIAPGLAAVAIYFMEYYFGELLWVIGLSGIVGAAILFLTGVFGFLYIFAFLVGLFGGWDENLLGEFRRAVDMVRGIQPLIRFLLKMTEWGCKISPLHNKVKMTIWEEGMAEADALTKEKVLLEM